MRCGTQATFGRLSPQFVPTISRTASANPIADTSAGRSARIV
jgi:hypothetical protein